jgi:predicted O-methyltransferase YrrM
MPRFHSVITRIVHFFTSKSLKSLKSEVYFPVLENVLSDERKLTSHNSIESLRKEALADRRRIHFDDKGTRASRNTSIRRIVIESAVSSKHGRLLFRLACLQSFGSIIELGTSLGFATAYMASACPETSVVSVEGSAAAVKYANQLHQKLGLLNITVVNADISEVLSLLKESTQPLLVYFDANHAYTPTMQYFTELIKAACSNSIFVFDDIHYSKEMSKAWDEICRHPHTTLCVDLYRMGIVFFNKMPEKKILRLNY